MLQRGAGAYKSNDKDFQGGRNPGVGNAMEMIVSSVRLLSVEMLKPV